MNPPKESPRKAISKKIEKQVREECGNACANPECREWSPATHELHHIDENPSNSVVENLLLLCGSCHNQQQAGVISEADIQTWKRMAVSGALPPQKGQPPRTSISASFTAETIHNSGIMAANVRVQGKTKTPVIVIGSLVTSADHYGYVEYLIKKLSKYRVWRPGAQGVPDNPAVVRKIFERDFGCLSKDLKLECFEKAVDYLHAKLRATTLVKMGKAGFSTFEEWKAKKPKL